MQRKHVLIIGDSINYYRPFHRFGSLSRDHGLFNDPERIALVVFTGGSDISPSLYGHKPNRLTFCNPKRDVFEMLSFRRAQRKKLPMIGICRGAQFLCAMAGGTLYQHVTGHDCRHAIRTCDDREMFVTSTHHQMQNPPDDAEILAWAEPQLSKYYFCGKDKEVEPPAVDYECVYYPNINAVGIQHHPEAMPDTSHGHRYAEELVARYLMERKVTEQDAVAQPT